MSDDLVIQADLDLFRRFLRVINTLQPTAPISHQAPLYRHEPLYRDPQWWLDDVEAAVESKDELFEEEDSEDELIEDDDEEEGVQGGGNEDQDEKDCDEDQESEEMNEEEEAETLDEDDDDDDNDELFDYYDEPKTAVGGKKPSPRQQPPPSPSPPPPLSPRRDENRSRDLRCWSHGCNGRRFTTRSNLRRHILERSRARPGYQCPRCGASFTRTTARNNHISRGSCNRIRRHSNGRIRPGVREN